MSRREISMPIGDAAFSLLTAAPRRVSCLSPPPMLARHSRARLFRSADPASDSGVALVLTLMAMALVASVGVSLLLLSDIEVTTAANHRDGAEVFYAADAALDHAIQELAVNADWTMALAGTVRSRMRGSLVLPGAAGGTSIDASRLTSDVQRLTFGSSGWGADTPRWRLFAHGRAAEEIGGMADHVYLLVWVADDVAEGDGAPERDSNGVVVIRARAMGLRRSQCDIQAVVARGTAPGLVRKVSWRVMR